MAGRKSKGRTAPDAQLAAAAEGSAEVSEAKYVGNKVKVPVTKNLPPKKRPQPHSPSEVAPRLNVLNARSGEVTPVTDVTPVEFVPPDSDPKLEEYRMAGLRDGRQLVINSTPLAVPGSAELEAVGTEETSVALPDSSAAGDIVPAAVPEPPVPVAPVMPDAATGIVEFGASPEANNSSGSDEHHPGRKKKKAMQKEALRAAERASAAEAVSVPPVAPPDEEPPISAVTAAPEMPEKKGKKERQRLSVPRAFVMLLSALLMLASFSPLLVGVLTPGIIPPFCIGLFFFFIAYKWPKITACKKPWFNALFTVCTILVIAGITLISFVFGKMYAASSIEPSPSRSDYTVIVLGCKIIGEEPSLMLHDRLEVASEFLLDHPGAYCIVSGGQGDDEPCPESTVMKRYLVSKGISELRIVEESKSTSTEENITNSCALLDSCNLYEDIVIVSDRFHQYRARQHVEKQGLRCYAVNSETRWYLVMQYWFREMVAVLLQMLGLKN